jgi:hypothetical protein
VETDLIRFVENIDQQKTNDSQQKTGSGVQGDISPPETGIVAVNFTQE